MGLRFLICIDLFNWVVDVGGMFFMGVFFYGGGYNMEWYGFLMYFYVGLFGYGEGMYGFGFGLMLFDRFMMFGFGYGGFLFGMFGMYFGVFYYGYVF